MATTIVYADTGDNYIESSSAVYLTTRAGLGTKTVTAQPLAVGQYFATPTYYAWEAFIAFDTTGLSVGAATLAVRTFNTQHSPGFTMEARLYDWGTAVEVADWISADNLGNYTLLATAPSPAAPVVQGTVTVTIPFVSDAAFATNINTAGKTRMVIASDRLRLSTTPTGDESFTFYGSAQTGTVDDPRLIVYSATPVFVQRIETGWVAVSPTTKTTASFNVQAGDLLIAYAMGSDDLAGMYPAVFSSSPVLTWNTEEDVFLGTGSNAWIQVKSAIATATGAMTVTFAAAANSATAAFGGCVLVFRNAAVGASNFGNASSGAASLALTTTVANSAIVFASADWNVVDGATTRVWSTINSLPPLETTYDRQVGDMTVYGGTYADAGATGSKTAGLTAPTGQKWVAVVVEVTYSPPGPVITAELYESGVLKQSLGTVTVTADGVLSLPWSAAQLATLSGANVELRLTSDILADVGAVEWNAVTETPVAGPALVESWGMVQA